MNSTITFHLNIWSFRIKESGTKIFITDRFLFFPNETATSITTNGLVPILLFHHVTDQGNIVDRYGVGLFGCQLAVSTYIYIR